MKRSISAIALGLAAALAVAAPASAHITANPNKTDAGAYALVGFNVAHGCDDAGTTKIAIKIPQDEWLFTSVTPYVNPGWDVETTTGKLKEPAEVHGSKVTEGITEVVYTKKGEPLDAHRGDILNVSIRLPEDAAGQTLFFPIVQECEGGKETGWIQIPAKGEDAHDLDLPAASITVTDASGGGHGDDAKDDASHDGDDAEKSGDEETSSDNANIALGLGGGALLLSLVALVRSGRSRRG